MKISFSLIASFFFFSAAAAVELHCKFEEVYHDQKQQNGLILIKNDHVRYQYDDKTLFTIIKNQYGNYLIPNYQKEKFQKINNNKIIESLISIYNDYPDIKTQYIIEDIFLKIDKSLENNFLKRIAIISDEHNLSIHFFDCHQTNIDKKFFQAGPFFDFK